MKKRDEILGLIKPVVNSEASFDRHSMNTS